MKNGFTLIELMIAVAIVAILAAIAYPSYQQYVLRTHRTDAQAELMRLSQQLQQYKLVNHTYENVSLTNIGGTQSATDYTINLNIDADNRGYSLTATPTGTQAKDGVLCFNSDLQRNRDTSANATATTCIAGLSTSSNWDN